MLLKRLAGLSVSPKQVQLITERNGQRLRAAREQATQAFLSGAAPPEAPEEPARLIVVTADGGRVQTRQTDAQDKWKEDKIGVVYDAVPTPESPGEPYHGPAPQTRSVTATLEPWERLGDHLSALADRRGYAHAAQRVFVSDGASAIRSVRERAFPDAVFILDYNHAEEHLRACAYAAFDATPAGQDWLERQIAHLWNGRVRAILANLTRLIRRRGAPNARTPDTDPRRIIANHIHYFRTNQDGMNYPEFRRRGWPIGSGIIESTVKLVGRRLKGLEKHWSLEGAEQTLQVVACLHSDDGEWDRAWEPDPLPRLA